MEKWSEGVLFIYQELEMAFYGVGLDVGYSALKIIGGDAQGTEKCSWFAPSGCGAKRNLTLGALKERNSFPLVRLEGEEFVAGVRPDRFRNSPRVLHPNYSASQQYRGMFLAALDKTGRHRINKLVTGLPVSQYLDCERRAQLVSQLEGEHEVRPGKVVTVERVKVVPSPVGSLFDQLTLGSAVEEFTREARVLVLDLGFFSVDWVFAGSMHLFHSGSGTSLLASAAIFERTVEMAREENGWKITRESLEEAIWAGQDFVRAEDGRSAQFAQVLQRAATDVVSGALTEVRNGIRFFEDVIDRVLLVGGGVPFFADEARSVFGSGRVVIPHNAVMANARGFYAAANSERNAH